MVYFSLNLRWVCHADSKEADHLSREQPAMSIERKFDRKREPLQACGQKLARFWHGFHGHDSTEKKTNIKLARTYTHHFTFSTA